MSRSTLLTCALIIAGSAGASAQSTAGKNRAPAPAATATDSGVFTVLHGGDTVAREQFSRTETELRGTLTLAGASRGVQEYKAVLAPDATVPLLEVTVREVADSGRSEGRVVQRARLIFKEDSAAIDALTDHGIETRLFGTQRGAVPYLNLSFALLEQAAHRARALGAGAVEVPFFNLGGGQTAVGKFAPANGDSLSFTIGAVEYHLRIDPAGRILGARIPAQDVTVERR
jgi:hypothetical protein